MDNILGILSVLAAHTIHYDHRRPPQALNELFDFIIHTYPRDCYSAEAADNIQKMVGAFPDLNKEAVNPL